MEVDIWSTSGLLNRKWTAIKCPPSEGGRCSSSGIKNLPNRTEMHQPFFSLVPFSPQLWHILVYHINLRVSPKLFLCPQKYIPKIIMLWMSNISVILCNQINNSCTTISLKVQPDTSSANYQTAHGKPAGMTNELEFSRLCFTTDVFTHFTIYW